MSNLKRAAALIMAGLVAACGDLAIGPQPATLETEMAAPNPMAVGEIDDSTGTMIP